MVVEGEPGIFPDPIARLFRAIGRVFDRSPDQEKGSAAREPETATEPPDEPRPDSN